KQGVLKLSTLPAILASPQLEESKALLAMFFEEETELSNSAIAEESVIIHLEIDSLNQFQNEGYRLAIGQGTIQLTAKTKEGIQRGLASLEQLIMLNLKKHGTCVLPLATIEDWARFPHRGFLLDCSRHFFEVDVIKKYIDLLAFYKMNTLHWHLTEDQGWRIAIEKYPALTDVGGYRVEPDGTIYGGYFSKSEIREVVAYASSRHIQIIPEIELPGHSQAAIAAYPHLSCTGDSIEVASDWGVFKEIYCAGNDSVFYFLEDVLTEVMELFPSKYIHIGGDEAPKVRWAECKKCRRRIASENLTGEEELQSYFIRRIQDFLNENGKQIIGWDEILEGGLAKGAIVQSWRGMEGGIEAVKHGNQAIMSPTSHAYLDYGLDAIDLKKVYSFDPIPKDLTPSERELIIGGECNMWTEHVPDEKTLDSRVFPRLMAMAEVLWSDSTARDYNEFADRVQSHYPILEKLGVHYGEESIAMSHKMELENGKAYLKLIPYSGDISLKYRYACAGCSHSANGYSNKIPIRKSGTIAVQPYRNDQPYGDSILIPVANHIGINARVIYDNPYSKWYTAGGQNGLVDGKLGTLNFRDGGWQGFQGYDFDCTLALDNPSKASSVTAHFYQYNNSWIFIPTKVKVEVSRDGVSWKSWGSAAGSGDPKKRGKFIQSIQITSDTPEVINFIRLSAKNIGTVPDWHEAAGSDAWLFIDEIIVK
ncbi:MAG TPA: family 20 glycosylhydrolase, partial [Cryomorphaceae bacterium]|nr:family 20 glycosylhydrolase [Cryomorphaceae bacterium]